MPPKPQRNQKLDVRFLLNDPPSSSHGTSASQPSQALPPRSVPSPHVAIPATVPMEIIPHQVPANPSGRSSKSSSSGSGSNESKNSDRKSSGSKSSSGGSAKSAKTAKSGDERGSERPKRARRVRVPNERSRCKICGHLFTQVGDLTKHIRTVHEKQRPFKCDFCDKAFGEKGTCSWNPQCITQLLTLLSGNLQKHRRSVHLNERPFKCLKCGAAFAFRDGLTRHTALVHEERNYVCSRCGARHKTKVQLKRHQEICSTAGSSSRPS